MNQMDDLMQKAKEACPYMQVELRGAFYDGWVKAVQEMREYVKKAVEVERERHRMQLAGISTAALGYWKEGDSIHPDYDTPALRDVAKLYAKIIKLHQAARR